MKWVFVGSAFLCLSAVFFLSVPPAAGNLPTAQLYIPLISKLSPQHRASPVRFRLALAVVPCFALTLLLCFQYSFHIRLHSFLAGLITTTKPVDLVGQRNPWDLWDPWGSSWLAVSLVFLAPFVHSFIQAASVQKSKEDRLFVYSVMAYYIFIWSVSCYQTVQCDEYKAWKFACFFYSNIQYSVVPLLVVLLVKCAEEGVWRAHWHAFTFVSTLMRVVLPIVPMAIHLIMSLAVVLSRIFSSLKQNKTEDHVYCLTCA